jgi:hypothetical protein
MRKFEEIDTVKIKYSNTNQIMVNYCKNYVKNFIILLQLSLQKTHIEWAKFVIKAPMERNCLSLNESGLYCSFNTIMLFWYFQRKSS